MHGSGTHPIITDAPPPKSLPTPPLLPFYPEGLTGLKNDPQ